MLMNIQILIELKEYIDKYNFVLEELSVRSDIEDMPIDEMISKGIDEIVIFLNIINDIDKLINALTEDIRGTMEAEGFDCNDYHRWNSHLKYNPMYLTGLYETFTDTLRNLEFFVMETLKGYRMLTEPAYIQTVFDDLSKDLRKERRTG